MWYENGTRIWATEELTGHFFKQYGVFRRSEALRGARQFGNDVPLSELPCSGLGRKADVDLTVRTMAFVIPTDTFRGRTSFKVCARVRRGRWLNEGNPRVLFALRAAADPFACVHTFPPPQAGGLTFELVEAHGETHDQLFVYIPEKETLLPGDNYYQSFPNLYSIRGTSPRCVRASCVWGDERRGSALHFSITTPP